jgi:Zn-dependent membrane protease YugP
MNFELLLAQGYGTSLGFGGIGIGYWILLGAMALVSMLISGTLKSRFNKYSQVPVRMTGAQVAEKMLRDNGINNVRVISTGGQLTDHYDPAKKTVNLSESVYGQNNVAAAAVAAHECGHAVQHKQAYAWLALRSKMVPAVQVASNMMNYLMWAMIIGIFLFQSQATIFIYGFVGAMAVVTLFSVITLPVEFDASKRALAWLERSGTTEMMEHRQAKDALFWAAMTYVAAAVAAIAQLAYWVMILLGRRD